MPTQNLNISYSKNLKIKISKFSFKMQSEEVLFDPTQISPPLPELSIN